MKKEEGMISMGMETAAFTPPDALRRNAFIKDMDQYRDMYARSLADPEAFWGSYANELHWYKPWDQVLQGNFQKARVSWFAGGKLNATVNCLDRHLSTSRKNKPAILWEGEGGEVKTYTYEQLYREVCRLASGLRHLGVRKGDRVAIYLPMIPELPIAMLACARIGAIHSVIFSRFSAESLRGRILDCDARLLITSDVRLDCGAIVPCKTTSDVALQGCPGLKKWLWYGDSRAM